MSNNLSNVAEESARGSLFLFSGATIASIILAISTILMGRLLGPELYGQYNLVLVIPSLLVLITDLGMNTGVTKFVASLRAEGKNERVPAIIKYSLLFRIGIGIIISIISIVFASYFALIINRPDFTFYIQLSSLSVVFQVIFTNTNSAFIGLDKSEYNALNSTIRAVLTTILQVALVVFSFNVTGALIGYVGGFAVSAIVGSILLSYKLLKPKTSSTSQTIPESGHNVLTLLARYSMPVYVSVLLVGFFPLYQQLVLAFFSTDIAIGNFRAAYNFVTLLATLSTALTTAFLPAFAKLETATPNVINTFFNKVNKYTCLLIVPITFTAIIFSTPIVKLLYGSTYTTAALFLALSCSIYLLEIIGSLTLRSVFNGLGKTRLTMNMTIINCLLLLVLTPALAVFYDVIGAIVAFVISTLAASIYAAVIAHKQLQLKFNFQINLRIYLISLLSALPPLTLLLFTPLNFILVLIFGGTLYILVFITLMPLFKIVNKPEINALSKIADKIPLINLIAKPLFSYQHKLLQYIDN
ncbi:MAG: oligosaccharide flippase family protein [Candidatus Bathyarchaeota archaeon]|uniref:oligosaccharide flippase family protein n=1 Tax=Candidatus Bathycorpusculum sp. TaxID=2994959 RepID=UPI002836C7A6|nr:oligosaccharide flippase family protein [Candidatus Termiticorpusculum sp.]MCL2256903.1 oligosaccharide flippase family protein [Candidatus Termiticorpusculum sp.]MCL2292973.1 oligosaccharide flippase family protein [Candidatus Termiticorpusculum sp.]